MIKTFFLTCFCFLFFFFLNLLAEINEQRVLSDLNGHKLNKGQWNVMSDKEPTKVKIANIKKNKSIKTVRIAFKACENTLTSTKNSYIASAQGVFDVVYKDDKYLKNSIDNNNENTNDFDFFFVDRKHNASKSTSDDFISLDKFWDEFSNAVKNNNKDQLALMVQFPLIATAGGNYKIKNRNDFIKYYDKLFTKQIKERILKGLIGFPLSVDPEDGDLRKGDIGIISPIMVFLDSGLSVDLIFRKINGKYKLVGFYSFA